MGPEGLHPWIQRELSDALAKSLSVMFEVLGRLGRCLLIEQKQVLHLSAKKQKPTGQSEELQVVQSHFSFLENNGTHLLGIHFKVHEGKWVTEDSQHGFTKGKC